MHLRLPLHATTVYEVQEPPQTLLPRLAGEEDVRRCTLVRSKIKLLVDNGNARFLSMMRALDLCLLAMQEDAPCIPAVRAAENLHQGGLASAILPDQGYDFPSRHFEVHIVQRLHAREGF
jgi:hypothetical protein